MSDGNEPWVDPRNSLEQRARALARSLVVSSTLDVYEPRILAALRAAARAAYQDGIAAGYAAAVTGTDESDTVAGDES